MAREAPAGDHLGRGGRVPAGSIDRARKASWIFPARTGREIPSANEPAEETDAEEGRRSEVGYVEIRTPEELGERVVEVLGFSPRARIEAGS